MERYNASERAQAKDRDESFLEARLLSIVIHRSTPFPHGNEASAPSGDYQAVPGYRVVFGNESLERVGEILDALGSQRCLILTSPTLARVSGLLPLLQKLLGPRCIGTFAGLSQRVPIDQAIAAVAEVRKLEADTLVSLGGTSVSDASRVISMCIAEGINDPEGLRQFHAAYERSGKLSLDPKRLLRQLFVPTTLSAGEFNTAGSILDDAHKKKLGFYDHHIVPDAIVLDGRATIDTPDWLWLSTGIKALDHAIERLYDQGHNPLVDACALNATALLFTYLPQCKREPANPAARLQCLIAAWLSMHGTPNVRLGLSHAIGHVLGVQFDIPHGITACVTQPYTMEFNRPASAGKQAMFATAAGVATNGMTDEEAAIAGARRVDRLITDLGLPHRLRDVNVPAADLPRLARLVVHDVNANKWNAIPVSEPEQVLAVLQAAW